jgi:hypothetical protein
MVQAAVELPRAFPGKLESMLSDLEFTYSPVREKVRELREYL